MNTPRPSKCEALDCRQPATCRLLYYPDAVRLCDEHAQWAEENKPGLADCLEEIPTERTA